MLLCKGLLQLVMTKMIPLKNFFFQNCSFVEFVVFRKNIKVIRIFFFFFLLEKTCSFPSFEMS